MSDTSKATFDASDFDKEGLVTIEKVAEDDKPKRFANKKANIAIIVVAAIMVVGVIAAIVFALS